MPRMKRAAFLLLFLTYTASLVFGQACNSGVWTITSQEPTSCHPYAANGIFSKALPNAGYGGPTDHLAANSDAIVANTITNAGGSTINDLNYFAVASPGTDAFGNPPLYYGRSTDPIYYINSCGGNCNAAGTYWHFPSAAAFSGSGDHFFKVWDQTNNKVLAVYNMTAWPSCSATTQAQAMMSCSIDLASGTGAQYSDYSTSTDYGPTHSGAPWGGHAGDSLEDQGMSLVIRQKELIEGVINHALYLNVTCVSSAATYVFPANGNSLLTACSSPANPNTTLRPVIGNLVFLDYTDAQIAALSLPTWQKAIITAFAHYGAYVGDTGPGLGFSVGRVEGGDAFVKASTTGPLYDWLETTEGLAPITASPPNSTRRWLLTYFNGIAGLTGHLHIANECIAKGLAGLAGGCTSNTVPVPPVCSFAQCETFDNYTVGADVNGLCSGDGWSGCWSSFSGAAMTIMAAPSGGVGGNAVVSTNASVYYRFFPPSDAMTIRFLMRNSVPGGVPPNGSHHVVIQNENQDPTINVIIDQGGRCASYNATTVAYDDLGACPQNSWATIDVEVATANANQYRIRLNLGGWSDWKTAENNFTAISQIVLIDTATNTHNFWVDGIGGAPAVTVSTPLNIFSATRIR